MGWNIFSLRCSDQKTENIVIPFFPSCLTFYQQVLMPTSSKMYPIWESDQFSSPPPQSLNPSHFHRSPLLYQWLFCFLLCNQNELLITRGQVRWCHCHLYTPWSVNSQLLSQWISTSTQRCTKMICGAPPTSPLVLTSFLPQFALL